MRIQLRFRLPVFTDKNLEEKLGDMHLDPVRRGIVVRAVDWKWNSPQWSLHGNSVAIPIRMTNLQDCARRPALESAWRSFLSLRDPAALPDRPTDCRSGKN